MSKKDFYDELDLRYPELAICLDRIDRTNPGKRRFYIPILTPNLDTKSLNTSKDIIRQTNSTIENQSNIKIENVEVKNYVEITMPKELCAFVGGNFWVKNVIDMEYVQSVTFNGGTDFFHHGHRHRWFQGTEVGKQSHYKGILNSMPTDKPYGSYRYIEPGSKWIVVFIGGDISKPQIIGRYTDPEVQT